MSEFLSVEQARATKGVRLVLTAGAPGPWSEAAKGMLFVKAIPYVRVRQEAGMENDALVAWTGIRNAPQIIAEDERPIHEWRDLIAFAEAREPQPRLVPQDPELRARMFELLEALAGPEGFAWCRRLLAFKPVMDLSGQSDETNPALEPVIRMAREYGYSDEAASKASKKAAAVLTRVAEQLRAQHERGERYLVGNQLSALDIHWATFAALVAPLPEQLCPMPDFIRTSYSNLDATVAAAVVPELLEHRDFIYREHLELPVIID